MTKYYEIKKVSYSANELETILDNRASLVEDFFGEELEKLEYKYNRHVKGYRILVSILGGLATALLLNFFIKGVFHHFKLPSELRIIAIAALFAGVSYAWYWLSGPFIEDLKIELIMNDFREEWKGVESL